ncbi:WXG100 family type VII secretion target [Ectobacillus panaciterrae]|uniref:WXG100 family type VII secretion target n=1 Tax=Ectobacillus panaciterrae TaxID=363872 RepID=UPI0009D6F882|nr:WXG100 family type VII secretion target [Ectobacillus panaciterrae]
MVQIKVTPERLEQVAKTVRDGKHQLEMIHKDLYSKTEYIASQWTGVTSQRFYQMFNNSKPKMFAVTQVLDSLADSLMHSANKFREADELVESNVGATCGKLLEKPMIEKIWDGLYDGTEDGVGDLIDGFKSLGDWETWEGMGNAVMHPIDTISSMYNVLSDSFIRDVWNGDAESRTRWGTYAVTQIGLGLLGDKGISKVSKVATSTNLVKGMSAVTDSTRYRQAIDVLNNYVGGTGERFAYAGVGGNVLKSSFDDVTFKEAKDLLNNFAVSKAEYKDLRKRSPNDRIRKSVNKDVPKVDPVYGYEVEKLEADHIVPMKVITEMDGFDMLPREQQIEVLNLDVNFVGLGKPTNASKGAKDWSTWLGHPGYGEVPENIRLEMLEREKVAKEAIKKVIKERLELLENDS